MSNKLVKNTSIYAIGNVIPKITHFFLLPLYTAYLSPRDFGIVQSMQVLTVILVIFFTLALDRSIYRLYFDFKTEENKKTYISTVFISIAGVSILLLILLFVFKNSVSLIYTSINFYPFYFYAIVSGFLTVFAVIPKIYYQINEKAKKFIFLSLLQFVSNTSFVIWFVVVTKEGATGYLKGLMLGNLITLPIFIYITIKTINFKFNFNYLKISLKYSLPIIPSLLSAWILNLSDRIFIERYFSMNEVGIYSLGYKIAGLVLIISSGFKLAYSPLFFKIANSENKINSEKKLSKYNFNYILVIMLICFLISFFSKELIGLFFKKEYFEVYKIVKLISIAYLFNQVSGLFNLSLYQMKKTIIVMYIGLGSAIINIGLNYILIPVYGIYGAAYATILSFLMFAIIKYLMSAKYYPINLNWKNLFLIFFGLIAVDLIFSSLSFTHIEMISMKIATVLIFGWLIYHFYSDKIMQIFKRN